MNHRRLVPLSTLLVVAVVCLAPALAAEKESKQGDKVYYCPVCDHGFLTLDEWKHFMQMNYPDVDTAKSEPQPMAREEYEQKQKDKVYYCPVCDTGFFSLAEWRHYMKLNYPGVALEGQRPIPMTRAQYERTRSGEQEVYYCNVCDRGFMTVDEWKHYMELNYPGADLSKEPRKMKAKELQKQQREKAQSESKAQ